MYHGSAAGLSATSDWTAESDQADAFFGYSVGTAGDVNGDGYSDVIVGAWRYDNGETDEGRAFAYHGSAAGLGATAAWTAESDQAGAVFGYSVGTAGDVNGDSYSDVIVGAYAYDNGESDEGRAFVYQGSATGLSTTTAWTAESNQAGANFGRSVGTAGDVNGNGYSDVIVGAIGYDNGESDEGRAFVYHGSASGLSTTTAWTAESDQADALFGWSVGTAGDVNGDGYSDVIVGANSYNNGETNEGRAFVYHGSASGLSTTTAWTAEGDQADAHFGFSLGTAGDVNGDGYSDVIVAAYLYDNGETDEGRAFVYHGSATGLSATANWTAESDQAGADFGRSAGTAGDVNGDSYSDVIVGAWKYDNGESDEGRVFVYLGSAEPSATPVVDPLGPQAAAEGDILNIEANFTASDATSAHSVIFDWGDGATTTDLVAAGVTTTTSSHVYADNGTSTLTVTVTDDDGNSGSSTTSVTVSNVAPVVVAGADQVALPGQALDLNPATSTDPGFDGVPPATTTEDFTARHRLGRRRYVHRGGDGDARRAGRADHRYYDWQPCIRRKRDIYGDRNGDRRRRRLRLRNLHGNRELGAAGRHRGGGNRVRRSGGPSEGRGIHHDHREHHLRPDSDTEARAGPRRRTPPCRQVQRHTHDHREHHRHDRR